jgi:hypothetical protein
VAIRGKGEATARGRGVTAVRVRYQVTFEFETSPPKTHRGTVAASSMPTCFARAAREAAKAHPGLRWTSMVCVLLERLDTPVAAGQAVDRGMSAPTGA